MQNKEIAGVLNGLIETLKDGQEGFRLAATDTKTPELSRLFNELSLERARMSGELQELVRSLGKEYETTSSLAGALHRSWIDLKAALLSKDDHAVLAECERGEDSAVKEYRKALDEETLPENIRGTVLRQSSAVKAAHDKVRALRDQHVEHAAVA